MFVVTTTLFTIDKRFGLDNIHKREQYNSKQMGSVQTTLTPASMGLLYVAPQYFIHLITNTLKTI
jgi:hypothetical protein